MTDKFKELDADLGERLRKLPDIQAENAFKNRLQNRLLDEHARTAKQKSNGKSLLRYGSVAALLMVIFAGWLAFFHPGNDSVNPTTGPLFIAQAQASNAPAPQITLGNGLDSLRQIEFKMPDIMPVSDQEGYVFKFKHGETTAEQAMELARRLEISNVELVEDGSNIPENRHIYITGKNADLTVWPYQGSWYYHNHHEKASTGGQLTSKETEAAALEWLKTTGLLPKEKFKIERKQDSQRTEFILRLKAAPDGSPLTGCVPEVRVMVDSGGQVIQANGTWYSEEQKVKVQLMDYVGALEALKRGEGTFEAGNYRHYQTGTATVQDVQTAYQLAYAIDFTPYLIPVAIFSGEYKPVGEPGDSFTALVPLVKNQIRPNSGNFALNAEFPIVPTALPNIIERGVEASKHELPQLAAFFNIQGQPLEDGSIKDAGGEISPTSWDGGWLYRTNLEKLVQNHNANRIEEDKALEIASNLVQKIPVLPGLPGKPVVRDDGSGFSLVVFPLLYGDVAVTSSDPPGFASYIAVQLGPDGDVWSVNCTRPMKQQSTEKPLPLLTPEQAWEQLLANNSLIHVEGFFGAMPGDRFLATSSSITSIELAYKPQHPELMRNENYDLVYVYRGQARVAGERLVNFTAYVDAVKL